MGNQSAEMLCCESCGAKLRDPLDWNALSKFAVPVYSICRFPLGPGVMQIILHLPMHCAAGTLAVRSKAGESNNVV